MIALAVVAATTHWWLGLRESDATLGGLPEARSDYTLDEFALTVMNEAGERRFFITAPHLERNPEDDSTLLNEPQVTLFEANRKAWSGRSLQGWISAQGDELQLIGSVELISDGEDQTHIETPLLKFFPDDQLAQTDQRVKLSRPDLIMTGLGLDANLELKRWELLDDVQARFNPAGI